MDLRGKKQPIGVTTIRGDGSQYMKICLEPYGDNWLRVSIPRKTKNIIDELDRKGEEIQKYRTPLDGTRLLDRLIIDFYVKEMGYSQERAEAMPGDFKKVGGWDGQAKYSFSNFFISIALAKKQNAKLDEKKAKRKLEIELWEKMVIEVGEDGAGEQPYDYDYDDDKIPIRNLTDREIEGLSSTMDEALKTLRRGVNFNGDQKEAYWGGIEKAKKWPYEYKVMPEILAERADLEKKFLNAFKGEHDWIVKETFDAIISRNFNDYFHSFKEQIMKDEGKRISEKYKLELAGDTETFYKGFYSIMPELNEFEIDSLAKLRFTTKLGKSLNGSWEKNHIAILENLEYVAQELPLGHLINNPKIQAFDSPDYSTGLGYAYYAPGLSTISFSKNYLKKTSEQGHLTDPLEFFAVTPHEIGHAVAEYFEKDIYSLGYKYWVNICGWDNNDKNLDATGSDRDVPRTAEKADMPLITDYAHKSPAEAFAEYYSCYYQNKAGIDAWLDTDDTSFLSENKRTVIDHVNFWRKDPRTGQMGKIQYPKVKEEKGIHYRNEIISESIITQNKELFDFMRKIIFTSKQLRG